MNTHGLLTRMAKLERRLAYATYWNVALAMIVALLIVKVVHG